MNKPLEMYWKDKSGTGHRFWIYRRGTRFNEPCPGIYIYARETSPHKWVPIYIGQTQNVNVRLTNPAQRESVDKHGATNIHVTIVTSEKSRLAIAKDLIEQWKPVCNIQFGLTPEEVRQANPKRVVRDGKGEIYPVRYDAANATLLSELLKEHSKAQEQDTIIAQLKRDFEATIARQQKQIEALTAGLQQVRARLAATSPPDGKLEANKSASARIRGAGPALQALVNNQ